MTSKLILDTFKSWAQNTKQGYKNFLQTDVSMFWIIDSSIDATLNFPTQMTDIYVADITKCYESIPLDGPDYLLDAITFITKAKYSQIASKHPRSVVSLWIRVARDGSPAATKWATNSPTSGIWFPLSIERLLNL